MVTILFYMVTVYFPRYLVEYFVLHGNCVCSKAVISLLLSVLSKITDSKARQQIGSVEKKSFVVLIIEGFFLVCVCFCLFFYSNCSLEATLKLP